MKAINVLLFGVAADIVGKNNVVVENVSSTDELKARLEKEHPALKTIAYAIAVNKQLVTGPTVLESNAAVAVLPPFSGG